MQEKKPLSPEHQLFVHAYIKHNFNATKAYQEVYQCDYDTARKSGSRLLTNVDIIEAKNKELDLLMSDKRELSFRVMKEYEKLAFSDMKHFVNPETGEIVCNNETDTAALESVTIEQLSSKDHEKPITTVKKYKLHPKIQALDALSKYICGFSEKHEITLPKNEILNFVRNLQEEDIEQLSKEE